MDVKEENDTDDSHGTDDSHCQQNVKISASDDQILCQLCAMNEKAECDKECTDKTCSGTSVCPIGRSTVGETSDCEQPCKTHGCLELQNNCNVGSISVGLKDTVHEISSAADVVHFDNPEDDDSLMAELNNLADDFKEHSHNQGLLTSECNDAILDNNCHCSDEGLPWCFTVTESQTDCTSSSSLQDAFMRFLRKKQVSRSQLL